MKPTAYVRHLLEQITSERPPAPAPVVTTPPPAALPDEVLRRLAHATLFIEMAVEASLQDADEIAPVLRETAEQRVSDLLGTKPRTQERAPARVEAAEQVGEA